MSFQSLGLAFNLFKGSRLIWPLVLNPINTRFGLSNTKKLRFTGVLGKHMNYTVILILSQFPRATSSAKNVLARPIKLLYGRNGSSQVFLESHG